MLRPALAVSLRILVISLLVLTTLVVGLRLIVPQLDGLRAPLERVLAEQSGHRVEVGTLRARWRVLSPRVTVSDVHVYTADETGPILVVDHLDLGFSPWRSLRQGRLVLGHVQVRGADLHLQRDESGRVRVHGADPVLPRRDEDAGSMPSADVLALLAGRAFTLSGSRLRWEDRRLGIDYQFDDLNLDIALEPRRARMAGEVFLPDELGRSFRVGMDLNHDGEWDDWSGKVFIQAGGLELAGLPEDTRAALGLRTGRLDGRLWLHWRKGDLQRAYLELGLRDLAMVSRPDSDLPAPVLGILEGRGLWYAREGGWDLRVDGLRLSRDGDDWPGGGLDLSVVEDARGVQVNAWLDYLRLEDLVPLILHQPWLDNPFQSQLVALSPKGTLTETRLAMTLPHGGDARFVTDGRFQGAGMSPWTVLPGIEGADGAFAFTDAGGELWLDSTSLGMTLPTLFDHELRADTLQGLVRWTPGPDVPRLHLDGVVLANADLQARGQGVIQLGDEPGMDLQVSFAEGDGARTAHYLPRDILPEKTHAWLSRGILGGRVIEGGLLFRGRFSDFPFREDEGVFQAIARVEEGVLDYEAGWPRLEGVSGTLEFRNQGMWIHGGQGRVFDARIQDAQVRIEDLESPVLNIEGRAQGPARDYLSFVTRSPLGEGLETLLDGVSVRGEAGLELRIDIPLQDRDDQVRPDTVKGRLTLDGNRLSLADPPLVLEAVRGVVDFTERSARARDVSARFNDARISVQLDRSPAGALEVRAAGPQPIRELLRDIAPEPWLARLEGDSRWEAQLSVPSPGGLQQGVLSLSSDLVGVRSDLPLPLAKTPQAPRALAVRIPLARDEKTPVRVTLGEDLRALFTFDEEGGLQRGELRLGGQAAVLPAQGFRIRGSLSGVSLDDWLAVLDDIGEMELVGREGGLRELDLHLDRLQVMGRRIDDLSLHARRHPAHWDAQVASPLMLGRIQWPLQDGEALVMDLELLDLDRLEGPAAETGGDRPRVDPGRLPPVRLTAQRLVLQGHRLKDLLLQTDAVADGLQIRSLSLSDEEGLTRGEIRGHWHRRAEDAHETLLQLTLETDDLGRSLSLLGFQHVFSGGKAALQARLHWPDTPAHVGWSGLEGEGRVRVEDGRLTEVDPGAGRLLGLFSLDLIPRRLALDFRDFFQRGFVFDRLQGAFQLSRGNVYTDDLSIQGPAARILIQGRTGVEARDYDQTITVTPSVKSTLPLAGALLGGPVAGLAVFVFDRVLGVGERIDEAARVEYRVTGDWSSPRVEAVARTPEGRGY
ncbi:YhdP family protein [Ectothiorhodospira lacustris]|uniref:YhdP family protein n=1 Tax=Ectothiorhodospira lacustris TaxID=2899127 RepID=UPI001EE98A16|nr:YhdP family protein [Ectothiorhodospira lacustris]MCG5508951.1 TIGR02099 family protein [Ectothiorhodospira lacustris]MCG5520742.1 TIGR02099 family protein [Ectothiorhodospira lacustris]